MSFDSHDGQTQSEPAQPTQKPSIGRIVHYVLSSGRSKGERRPAIIVRVWSDTCVQLQVFTDSGNDFSSDQQGYDGLFWATSVLLDESGERPHSWHFPERV